jgi:hypothetical protein
MPQQFIITGNVFLSDNGNPLLEGKVQVFDRDLPSIERRGAAPQLLGESSLDANGRFRIEYTDEQFRKGEGELATRRGISKINPDLSFSIFAPSGRKLPITQLGEANRALLADRMGASSG